MTANSVDKHWSNIVLNVKLQVKTRFKTFHLLLELFCTLSPGTPLPTRHPLTEIFEYPSNKRVIYGPQLNL